VPLTLIGGTPEHLLFKKKKKMIQSVILQQCGPSWTSQTCIVGDPVELKSQYAVNRSAEMNK